MYVLSSLLLRTHLNKCVSFSILLITIVFVFVLFCFFFAFHFQETAKTFSGSPAWKFLSRENARITPVKKGKNDFASPEKIFLLCPWRDINTKSKGILYSQPLAICSFINLSFQVENLFFCKIPIKMKPDLGTN